ncbi:MAG TPA: hypothetical protein VGJ01_17390 [Pseudolabrys sp.]|jgi:hypothetical protein
MSHPRTGRRAAHIAEIRALAETMTTGKISQATGLSRSTVKYYAHLGRISLTSRAFRVIVHLDPGTRRALKSEAMRRGVRVEHLADDVLRAAAERSLFSSILGGD